jgi:hypothetical protein
MEEPKHVKKILARLNEELERRFGVRLTASPSHLLEVYEVYGNRKSIIVHQYGLKEALSREDYAKAAIITEAAMLLLKEIAPTRTKPRKRRKGK